VKDLSADLEVISGFMELRPELPPYWGSWPEHKWWKLGRTNGGGMKPQMGCGAFVLRLVVIGLACWFVAWILK
jgi:hypothetical protein